MTDHIVDTLHIEAAVDELNLLPDSVIEKFMEAYGGELATNEVATVRSRLEKYKTRAERRATFWLSKLDSSVIANTKVLYSAMNRQPGGKYLGSHSGFNRYIWMLAVAGKGTSLEEEDLASFFNDCGLWLASAVLIDRLDDVDADLAGGIRYNPRRERLRRIMASSINFRWASELICTEFAAEVEENSQKYMEISFVTVSSVKRLFRWVNKYTKYLDKQAEGGNQSGFPVYDAGVEKLLMEMALTQGAYADRSFKELITTLDLEAYPFTVIDGTIHATAPREATYSVESALFYMARRLLQDQNRSDLFERVVQRALLKVVPPTIEIPHGDITCPILGTGNKGQIDFVVRGGEGRVVVGECKAMAATSGTVGVIRAFYDQIGYAVNQLDLRMTNVRSGAEIRVGSELISVPENLLTGLIVPLHSYGTAVWDKDCLDEIAARDRTVAIIPLHALMLTIRAMPSMEELQSYFEFRYWLIDHQVQVFDEIDILAAYIFASGQLPDLTDEEVAMGPRIRSYSTVLEARLEDDMPSTAHAWRRRLKTTLV